MCIYDELANTYVHPHFYHETENPRCHCIVMLLAMRVHNGRRYEVINALYLKKHTYIYVEVIIHNGYIYMYIYVPHQL